MASLETTYVDTFAEAQALAKKAEYHREQVKFSNSPDGRLLNSILQLAFETGAWGMGKVGDLLGILLDIGARHRDR